MIFQIPIEPLEERYSSQWERWFSAFFDKHDVPYQNIPGSILRGEIKDGAFLDAFNTNYWKSAQLKNIIELLEKGEIRDGDVLFFHDLWFPGIEQLAYIRDVTKKKFRIAGYLHAGTWDAYDFLTRHLTPWVTSFEQMLMDVVDVVMLGSNFHAGLISAAFPAYSKKLNVIGLPFNFLEIVPSPEMSIPALAHDTTFTIVFPHRLDQEKRPELFDSLKNYAPLQDYAFVKTRDYWNGYKQDYYDLLSTCTLAVSFAKQETFGIAMVEAAILGCLPVLPKALAYPDVWPQEGPLWYTDVAQVKEILSSYLRSFNAKEHKKRLSICTSHLRANYSLQTVGEKVLRLLL
jgi:glycosyltransferase involved in cell wall biosynthesis